MTLVKEKECTQKNFNKLFRLSLMLTGSYIVLYCLTCTGEFEKISGNVEILMLYLLFLILPLLLIIVWTISIIQYLALEIQKLGESDNLLKRTMLCLSIVPILLWGIGIFYSTLVLGRYVIENWLFIDELVKWVGILGGISLIGVLGEFCCIRTRKIIGLRGKGIIIWIIANGLAVILSMSAKAVIACAEERASEVWFQKAIEFTEQNGPFIENPYLPR